MERLNRIQRKIQVLEASLREAYQCAIYLHEQGEIFHGSSVEMESVEYWRELQRYEYELQHITGA